MYEINQNPQAVYDALANAYNLGPGVGNGNVDDGDDDDDDSSEQQFYDPRYDQLQQGIELVSRIVLDEQNAKLARQAEEELDAELSQLREKYGDFDERYILAMMDMDMTGEQAIQEYQKLTQNLLQNNPRPFAPSILGNSGGGSGLPSQAIDPTKWDGKQTRDVVAQMLAAAARED